MARRYEGKIQILTSAGLDSAGNSAEAVEDFKWPASIITAFDANGSLWQRFGVRFRGTWVLINQDGKLLSRTSPHPDDDRLFEQLDHLVAQ